MNKIMKVIKTVDELKTLIKEKVLPAYEAAYEDENSDFEELYMDAGICWYCDNVLDEFIYEVFQDIVNYEWLYPTISFDNATPEESILPRIEWMRKFING